MTVAVEHLLARWRETIETALVETIDDSAPLAPPLDDAMRHAVVSGGKRMRPMLVLASCHAAGGSAEDALPAAVAVELIHAYSLVHDDLPAMDDDVLRRGLPTVHAKYGEALGILAGDALQTLAFERIVDGAPSPDVAVAQVALLARAAGRAGMVGGQALDVLGEETGADLELVETIHRSKTGALLAVCFGLGAASARADAETTRRLGDAGRALGLAFQIHDDVLDVTRSTEELGKTAGKDLEAHKATWPAVAGLDASRAAAARLSAAAYEELDPLGSAAAPLLALARSVVERTR